MESIYIRNKSVFDYHILAIDDNQTILQLIHATLKGYGFTVSTANSGSNGLKYLEKKIPDIILLDIMMPEMDGYQVCKIIKSNPETKNIPVIFLTAKDTSDSIADCFNVGGSDYVAKPVNVTELIARMLTHITLSQNKVELEKYNESLEEKIKIRTNDLLLANRKLNQIANSKQYVISLLSHELNTPITQIKTATELLKTDIDPETHNEMILYIQEANLWLQKLSKLTNLITTIKLDQQKMNFETSKFSTIMEEVFFKLQDKINLKRIYIQRECNIKSLELIVVTQLIKQSLEFILDNAIKYTALDSTIIIKTDINDNILKIQILDQGKGFSEEYIRNPFELFQSDELMYHQQGIGLSLTAAKLIIESHDGTLQISNNPNGGACVTIQLPIE